MVNPSQRGGESGGTSASQLAPPPAHPDALGQASGTPGQGHGPSRGPRLVSHQHHGPAPSLGGGRKAGRTQTSQGSTQGRQPGPV